MEELANDPKMKFSAVRARKTKFEPALLVIERLSGTQVVGQAVGQVEQVPRVLEHHGIPSKYLKERGNSVVGMIGFKPSTYCPTPGGLRL